MGAPTESMLTGKQTLYALDAWALMEIAKIFPDMKQSTPNPARLVVRGKNRACSSKVTSKGMCRCWRLRLSMLHRQFRFFTGFPVNHALL
jgi:hypothetical protein